MNTLVLAIAGVLVFAGLVLIVVSFLVGRARPATDASEAESAPSGEAKEEGAFIDEPLATDLATQLAGRRKSSSAPSAPSAPSAASTDTSAESPVATDAEGEATDIPPETDPGSQDDGAEAPTPTVAPVPEPVTRTEPAEQAGFDLQVRLGFEPLANALGEEGVVQFNKALTHTESGEAKLRLYVEIADKSSQQQTTGLGSAAHVQVTSYTDNPVLLEHLKHTLTEILEWDDVGAADGASGSEKESD